MIPQNWEYVDSKIGAAPAHIKHAKSEGFNTLSEAIVGMMAGTKRIVDIFSALHMAPRRFNMYRAKLYELGIECSNEINGPVTIKKKRKNVLKFTSVSDDGLLLEEDPHPFGFTRGFCKEDYHG